MMMKRWLSHKRLSCNQNIVHVTCRYAHARMNIIPVGDKSSLRIGTSVNIPATRERERSPIILEHDGKYKIDLHGFTPLQLFRGNVLRVTDISLPYCELEKMYRLGRGDIFISSQMTQGTAFHDQLEEEAGKNLIGETVTIQVTDLKTKEDKFALKILDQMVKFDTIRATDTDIRELYVFGMINGYPVTGYIDCISLDEKRAMLIRETKTRGKNTMPGLIQLLSAYHQVLVYHELLNNIVRNPMTYYEKFYETMGIDKKLAFSEPLRSLTGYSCLEDIHAEFQNFLPVSDRLKVTYIHQKSGSHIDTVDYPFDPEIYRMLIDYVFSFWQGQRAPYGIDPDSTYICRMCPYHTKCQWYEDIRNEQFAIS